MPHLVRQQDGQERKGKGHAQQKAGRLLEHPGQREEIGFRGVGRKVGVEVVLQARPDDERGEHGKRQHQTVQPPAAARR